MGKESRARVLKDHQATAIGRNIRVSPRKLNLVAQTIRGKKGRSRSERADFLAQAHRQDREEGSSVGDRQRRKHHDLDVDDLVVSEASVGKNLVMKRFHARARGNSGGIEKFFSQITIIVEEKREEAPAKTEAKGDKPAAKKTSGKAPAKKPAANKTAKETA